MSLSDSPHRSNDHAVLERRIERLEALIRSSPSRPINVPQQVQSWWGGLPSNAVPLKVAFSSASPTSSLGQNTSTGEVVWVDTAEIFNNDPPTQFGDSAVFYGLLEQASFGSPAQPLYRLIASAHGRSDYQIECNPDAGITLNGVVLESGTTVTTTIAGYGPLDNIIPFYPPRLSFDNILSSTWDWFYGTWQGGFAMADCDAGRGRGASTPGFLVSGSANIHLNGIDDGEVFSIDVIYMGYSGGNVDPLSIATITMAWFNGGLNTLSAASVSQGIYTDASSSFEVKFSNGTTGTISVIPAPAPAGNAIGSINISVTPTDTGAPQAIIIVRGGRAST